MCFTVVIIAIEKVTAQNLAGPNFQRKLPTTQVEEQKPLVQPSSQNQFQRRGDLLQLDRTVARITSTLGMNLILVVETEEEDRGGSPAESRHFTRLAPQGGQVLLLVNRPPCGDILNPNHLSGSLE